MSISYGVGVCERDSYILIFSLDFTHIPTRIRAVLTPIDPKVFQTRKTSHIEKLVGQILLQITLQIKFF